MSRSQKHAGLFLVPWFNTAEWNYVFLLAYSDAKDKQLDALNFLKIWKMRTPILPTGVEGTLIVLDALLIDEDVLRMESVIQLYSIALMRFLNLTLSNNEKQGTFTKASIKHDIPKWLISLRHEIAHGVQLPSKSNLKMGLNFGFNWLKEKYWEIEKPNIQDFYGKTAYFSNDTASTYLKDYVYLAMALFENNKLDELYFQSIMDKLNKKYQKKITDPLQIFAILEEAIRQSLAGDQSEQDIKSMLSILLNQKAMLKTNIVQDDELSKINKNFRDIWERLLNILHLNKLLSHMFTHLFDIISDVTHYDSAKKMAALWVKELLHSLQTLKEPSEENNHLELDAYTYLYTNELLEFQKNVLLASNQHSVHFIDILFKFNECSETFSIDSNALNIELMDTDSRHVEDRIYTLSDINSEGVFLDEELTEFNINNLSTATCHHSPKKQITSQNRWQQVEDTSAFINCPIGVLPHQIAQKHPFLPCI